MTKPAIAAATRIGPFTGRSYALPGRICRVHDGRDVRVELVEPRTELEPARGFQRFAGEQDPRPDDLDALEAAGVEQPLHHLAVEQRERELLFAALHTEAPVEVVVLELDVVHAEMIAETRQEILVREMQGRARGRDRQQSARKAVVRARNLALSVGVF